MGCCECVNSEREKILSIFSPDEAERTEITPRSQVLKIQMMKEMERLGKDGNLGGGSGGGTGGGRGGGLGATEDRKKDFLVNESFTGKNSVEALEAGVEEVRIMGLPDYSSNSSLASWKPSVL